MDEHEPLFRLTEDPLYREQYRTLYDSLDGEVLTLDGVDDEDPSAP